ncbi:hypothetical protein [Acidovorax sp. Root267]|uniref:YncE family protein n=1 Tax=Acidovorax sp. Root267 TaxID=1736505 RepID=UPI000B2C400D|nr:hypothetical protein [Acidovorax sp. Root267]
MRLACIGPAEVLNSIASMGRTEDVSWSPDGRRVALAAITLDKVLIVGVDCQFENGQKVLYLTDTVEVASTSLRRPHGLCWISNSIVAVASREGNVSLFDIPRADRLTSVCDLQPRSVISKRETELLSTPGSLCARDLGAGLHELWVCNGFSHYVTHHLLNTAAGFSHLDAQLLMQHGLEVPDGVALDASADWVAVSNHDRHLVALYRNDEFLAPGNEPAAELRGISYPHGLCFLSGGRILLVADAGAPHVAVFHRAASGWKNLAQPNAVIRVLDDDVFEQGHHNPREGGPKGIDVHEPWGLLVTTCAEQPLAFFDIDELMAQAEAFAPEEAMQTGSPDTSPADRTRVTVLRLARDVVAREAAVTAAVRKEMGLMRASWSWRVTAPLRTLADGWIRWRSRRRKG